MLCYRAAVKAGKTFVDDVESNVASDEEFISSWAFYPITVLRKQGFFADEMIRPTEFASRADAAQLLYEIMLMEEKA